MSFDFDYPLEEILTYQGISPKPFDFDNYWKEGLMEAKGKGVSATWVKADFSSPFAECYDLFFEGTGGARIYAKVLMPKKIQQKAPALLHFHGYSGASGEWTSYLGFVAAGFVVAALDCRGQGGVSEDFNGAKGSSLKSQIINGLLGPITNLYFRHVFLDTTILTQIVMALPEVDANRVGVYGNSQGGGLALACAALVPEIKKVAIAYPFLCDYKRLWQMEQAKGEYWELRDYFQQMGSQPQLEEKLFLKLGYIDVQHLCSRIQADVLMGVGLQDTICPPSTQFAAYNKIASKKSYLLYPDQGHGNLTGFSDKVYQFLLEL